MCEYPGTKDAAALVVAAARQVAAARADYSADEIDGALFDRLWLAQYDFLTAARREVGLKPLPYEGRRSPVQPASSG
ncbi:hypothetical protein [Nocardia lasii]|uniref:Uncharacterized protein n=1 Tax=Nocardia lasii TaxID=1616107 RepID=A0ABW1JQH6_9NOCA